MAFIDGALGGARGLEHRGVCRMGTVWHCERRFCGPGGDGLQMMHGHL